jgi:hypothetical protein
MGSITRQCFRRVCEEWKATMSFVMSVSLFVHLELLSSQLKKFDATENPVWLKSKRKIQALEKTSAFMIKSHWILSRISIKCRGNQKHISCLTQVRSTLRVLRLLPRSEMRTALFCVITQRAVVISYRSFWSTHRSHLQGSRIWNESWLPQQGVYKWKWGQS